MKPPTRICLGVASVILGAGTVLPASNAPEAVSPGTLGGISAIGTPCPTFSWAGSESRQGYELVVYEIKSIDDAAEEVRADTSPEQVQPVIRHHLPSNTYSWTPPLGQCLSSGGRYAWAIRDSEASGQTGEWSDTRLFEVSAQPSMAEVKAALQILSDYLATSEEVLESVLPSPRRMKEQQEELHAYAVRTEASGDEALSFPGTAAIRGEQSDPTGENYGLHGISESGEGMSSGLIGQSTAASGGTRGVVGQVQSLEGIAGLFENTSGGQILGGWNDGTEVFAVEGNGQVVASQFVGDGSLLTNVSAADVDCTGCVSEPELDFDATTSTEVMPIVLANDGSGSGLDADLLDGQNSGSFAAFSHSHSGETWSTSDLWGLRVENSQNTGYGLFGNSDATGYGRGVYGHAGGATGVGVYGYATGSGGANSGVTGWTLSPFGYGVYGRASSATGISYGIYGQSDSPDGFGIYGTASGSPGSPTGVAGESSSPDGVGVRGTATSTTGPVHGVYGLSHSDDQGAGVYGEGTSTDGWGWGVYGVTHSNTASGVYGTGPFLGVAGHATDHNQPFNIGVWGEGDGLPGRGVVGIVTNLSGGTGTPMGVWGGLDGEASGFAGYFVGDVQVTETLTKGGGAFKIDHPLEPETKYLSHSFVESPDMMNIYNGNVTLDDNAEAWIDLPKWFQSLNRDFRYQLTPVGRYSSLWIAEEIRNNRFKIAGSVAGAKVSWMVTGIRHDAWAEAHRIPVEEDKPKEEVGTYLHPEAHGMPRESGLDYRRDAPIRQWREQLRRAERKDP